MTAPQKPIKTKSHQLGRSLAPKLQFAIAAAETITDLYGTAKGYWRQNFAYTVIVTERDILYAEVHDWLTETLPNEKHHSLAVTSSRSSTNVIEPELGSTYKVEPLTVRFNDSSVRTVIIEGFQVSVSLNKPDAAIDNEYGRSLNPAKIEFVTKSYAAQQAVVRQLQKLNANRATSRKAVLQMVGQWNSWTKRSDLPPRTMDSVILPKIQKDAIIKDLQTFLDAEDHYNRLAIPWHRGYMFEGPPGTGKTSLVKALAYHFNLDLWYISLSDLKAEASLIGLLAEVGPRSLLLLEDIDTMEITHERDGATQGQISMSSLLNTLDGVATPHGLITMMTTNRFEILDPALTRAGRMDLIEKIDYPSLNTITDMFEHFFEEGPRWFGVGVDLHKLDDPIVGLSSAMVAEVLKRNMTDIQAASESLADLIEEHWNKEKANVN